MSNSRHVGTIVIGAGLTGLTCAHHLRKSNHSVVVLEGSARAGGVIKTSEESGFLYENGPHSCLFTEDIKELISELQIKEQLTNASSNSKSRFLVRNGKVIKVPLSPPAFLTSPILSTGARMRVLAEPFIPANRKGDSESVSAFVKRRFGKEFLEQIADPFVSGVFAGDPLHLSMKYAFPSIYALEQEHGSIIKSAITSKRNRSTNKKGNVTRRPISFRKGMQTLTDALAKTLSDFIVSNAEVVSVLRCATGWKVSFLREGEISSCIADSVVCTIPTHKISSIEWPDSARGHITTIARKPYAGLVTLAIGLKNANESVIPQGFGMLVPQREKRGILGILNPSSVFPERAPPGHEILTVFIGGSRNPRAVYASSEDLQLSALNELESLFGYRDRPVLLRLTRIESAIPQYDLDHSSVIEAANKIESEHLGLFLGGSWRGGISVGDCVLSGKKLAKEALRGVL